MGRVINESGHYISAMLSGETVLTIVNTPVTRFKCTQFHATKKSTIQQYNEDVLWANAIQRIS
jgi:hypothetical protein